MEKQKIASYVKYREYGFAKVNVFKNGGSSVFILNFMPGQEMQQHYHPGSQLFFLVIQGNGIFTIDGKNTEATQGDMIHCVGTEKLGFTNTGNGPATIYVAMCRLDETECVDNC